MALSILLALFGIFPFGISGEPSLFHSFLLVEQFLDGPKGGKSHNTEQGTPKEVLDQKCRHRAYQSKQQKYPPGACAKVVFSLDDDGVEYADGQECGTAEQ